MCSGWLLIAEVKSRLDPNTGGADPEQFVKAICELGFTSTSKVLHLTPSFTVYKDLLQSLLKGVISSCRTSPIKCLYCSTFRKRLDLMLLKVISFQMLSLLCDVGREDSS